MSFGVALMLRVSNAAFPATGGSGSTVAISNAGDVSPGQVAKVVALLRSGTFKALTIENVVNKMTTKVKICFITNYR
ncbi:hypothetical protein C1645_779423 [Glomus cerebriforme]|uniref:Uncharacterized protein n=1 Tax=Glomus cerebriforme TaxID=658196 RepID=A0A397SRC5_9GLOM|nr:hypothetical protein C1645_779423 [Glomus cerebriforme]